MADGSRAPDTPKRGRGRPRRASAEAVVDAAMSIGLPDLTMTGVAKRLEVSVGTIYGYVDDLDSLRAAVAERLLAGLEVRESSNTPVEVLVGYGTDFREVLTVNPGLNLAILAHDLRPFWEYHEWHIGRLLDLGVETGAAVILAEDIASFVLSYVSGASEPRNDIEDTWWGLTERIRAAHAATPFADEHAIFSWTLNAHVSGLLAAIERGVLPWSS